MEFNMEDCVLCLGSQYQSFDQVVNYKRCLSQNQTSKPDVCGIKQKFNLKLVVAD